MLEVDLDYSGAMKQARASMAKLRPMPAHLKYTCAKLLFSRAQKIKDFFWCVEFKNGGVDVLGINGNFFRLMKVKRQLTTKRS